MRWEPMMLFTTRSPQLTDPCHLRGVSIHCVLGFACPARMPRRRTSASPIAFRSCPLLFVLVSLRAARSYVPPGAASRSTSRRARTGYDADDAAARPMDVEASWAKLSGEGAFDELDEHELG